MSGVKGEVSAPGPVGVAQETVTVLTFDECYLKYASDVFKWSLSYCRWNHSGAKDVTQEVFLKLLAALPSLRAHDDLYGWLRQVTAHVALKKLRAEQSLFSRAVKAFSLAGPPVAVSAEGQLIQNELERDAVNALKKLPAQEQLVASMKLIEGLSQKEIAQTLSMSEGYVSKLVSRAFEKLRAAGWELSDET